MSIKKIVITGGPCAGKTTAMTYLRQELEQNGYTTIIVPEAATIGIMSGFKPGVNITGFDFQKIVTRLITGIEDAFIEAAGTITGPTVLLCDRGLMDMHAYISDPEFIRLCYEEFRSNVISWRDTRYDAVIHLRTAAMGAQEFYTLSNNKARSETPDQAVELDEKTLKAWNGHPHLRVIDNSTKGFENKLHRVRKEVYQVLGIPVPLEIERKFLIKPVAVSRLPVDVVKVEIEQVYIIGTTDGEEVRVRKRGQNGSYAYYRTVKRELEGGIRAESEEQIDQSEYEFSLRYQIPGSKVIRKNRVCFLWKEQYFELDCFKKPKKMQVLEIELTDKQDEVILPPFIQIEREVTEDPSYRNSALANC